MWPFTPPSHLHPPGYKQVIKNNPSFNFNANVLYKQKQNNKCISKCDQKSNLLESTLLFKKKSKVDFQSK